MVEYSSLKETFVPPPVKHRKYHGIANRKNSITRRLGRELKIINFWHKHKYFKLELTSSGGFLCWSYRSELLSENPESKRGLWGSVLLCLTVGDWRIPRKGELLSSVMYPLVNPPHFQTIRHMCHCFKLSRSQYKVTICEFKKRGICKEEGVYRDGI